MSSPISRAFAEFYPRKAWQQALRDIPADSTLEISKIIRRDRLGWFGLYSGGGVAIGLTIVDGIVFWGMASAIAAVNLPLLMTLIGASIAIRGVYTTLERYLEWVSSKLGENRANVLNARLGRRRLAPEDSDNSTGLEFEHIATAEVEKVKMGFTRFGQLFYDAAVIAGTALVAAWTAPLLLQSVAILMAVAGIGAVTFRATRRDLERKGEVAEADKRRRSFIRNVLELDTLRLVLRSGLEKKAEKGFERVSNNYRDKASRAYLKDFNSRATARNIYNLILVPILFALSTRLPLSPDLALRVSTMFGVLLYGIGSLQRFPGSLNVFATGVRSLRSIVERTSLNRSSRDYIQRLSRENHIPIELRNVTLKLGDRILIEGLTTKILKGERVVIVGENGIGKTMLLRFLAGVPDKKLEVTGEVLIYGQPIEKLNRQDLRAAIGYLPQKPKFLEEDLEGSGRPATIRDNLLWVGGYSPDADLDVFFKASLAKVGLRAAGILDQVPGELSGGETQSLMAVLSSIGEQEIVLTDEPLAALNGVGKEQVGVYLANQQYGRAVLGVEHEPDLVNGYDKVIVLKKSQKGTGYVAEQTRPNTSWWLAVQKEAIQRAGKRYVPYDKVDLALERNTLERLFRKHDTWNHATEMACNYTLGYLGWAADAGKPSVDASDIANDLATKIHLRVDWGLMINTSHAEEICKRLTKLDLVTKQPDGKWSLTTTGQQWATTQQFAGHVSARISGSQSYLPIL